MTHLCCFSDSRMTISQDRLVATARSYGIECHVWRETDLSREFWDFNKDLLQQERGFGFYVWKPYVVLQTILKLKEGDILIYADAGNEFVNNPQFAIDEMDQDIMFFSNGWHHIHWCKADTMEAINGMEYQERVCDNPVYKERKQVQASTFIMKVTKKTIDFVKEWYAYSCITPLIDNEPSVKLNHPEFQEHRWDQSILTCLQIKYRYKLHWFPSTYAYHIRGEHPEDKYPELLLHHRKRNNEY